MAAIEGPLSKWTNVVKGWQYRWFVLDENAGLLSYYTSKDKMKRGSRRGCVRLKGAIIGIDDEDDSTFTITVDHKTFHFQARDAEEREKWIEQLENTIMKHARHVAGRSMTGGVPSAEEFDRKLAETDAYLQILINQVENLEKRIEACEDVAMKEKYNVIKVTANAMIEAIKHSIMMLQISKETLKEPLLNGSMHEPIITPDTDFDHFGASDTVKQPDDLAVCEGGELASGIEVNGALPVNLAEPGAGVVPDQLLQKEESGEPLISYSSSEEEDFFDAEEDQKSPKGSPDKKVSHAHTKPKSVSIEKDGKTASNGEVSPKKVEASPVKPVKADVKDDFYDVNRKTGSSGKVSPKKGEALPVKPVKADVKDDYFDELYDEEDKEDLGSLEKHGSVITHLLSQVRIGMDLTKVVLPTFILERKSLLEMYADFFAHADLFLKIPDMPTPRERIIQLVRWYMSAFHASRDSEIAKKPYNPILGETFVCYWNVPGYEKSEELVEDGPVPWATTNNLCFIAEQVSHHPPTFYAEHADKRIALDGYIWTKSKFLGLSIGVHMIGQAVISLMDWEEEYVITFPNGYGRSILTTPWVEMGGKITVSCAKTGYNASVDFLTKPFYGGKKHRIAGNIYAPNEKKAICILDGEWNDIVWAKHETGMSEAFVDTKKLPIINKQVRPRTDQGEFESRRLWENVTHNLKVGEVEKATDYKQKLEQRQREEAKERKEKGLKVETKNFHEVGEHWVYDRPLHKRLSKSASTTPTGTLS